MNYFNRPLRKVLSTDATGAAFTAKTLTLTEPTGSGVLDISGVPSGYTPCWLVLLPYGQGADNDTFEMRVIGWHRIPTAVQGVIQWLPQPLHQLTCTMSALVGTAGGLIVAAERMCDTIVEHTTLKADARTLDSAAVFYGQSQYRSPANDLAASVKVQLDGVEKVEVLFAKLLTTTAMNALYSFL